MEIFFKDIIILHTCAKNYNHDVQFLRYGVKQTEYFVISDHFLPFYPSPLMYPKFWKKKKKMYGDIIIFHMCTMNDNHMMYGSWDMEHVGQNFLSFWSVFCASTTPKTWNIKILKNWKTLRDIIVWHMCTIGNNHMMYGSWDKELTEFFVIFLPFTPLSMVYTFESQGRGRQKKDRKTSGYYCLLSRGTDFFSTPALASALKEFFVTKCFKTLLLLVILLWLSHFMNWV